MRSASVARVLLALLVLGWMGASRADAQGRGGDVQSRLLLQAATLESRGDLDGAEAALRSLLDADPTSAGALFALERVLRAKGELGRLRPLVDSFLARVSDTEVRALKLELLASADSTELMVQEAEAWIREEPREQTFRAVAGVYERALGAERALEVLRRGRALLDGSALALETGDLLATVGDIDGAVDEWALAVGDDGSGMDAAESRLERLGERRVGAARRLVQTLGESQRPRLRRATLGVALDFGLEPEALDLARRHADDLNGRVRATFLTEVGILGREAEMAELASWAYEELGGDASNVEERRQFDERIVAIALQAGDTMAALEAQRRIVGSFPDASDEWRRATSEAIRLEATAEPQAVGASWSRFRSEFPDAPELDAVAATISRTLQTRNELEGAVAVLEGVEGPRSSLERAYLHLGNGDVEGGRSMLLRAVGGLSPSEATPVIQFASLLGRLSGEAAEALVSAHVAAHRGKAATAAEGLARTTGGLEAGDRPPLLAEAARMAESAGADASAADIRRQLLDEHPNSPEVAEATLELARHAAASTGNEDEAIRLLEDLITRRPNAAVVPEARLELQRLRNRGS